jgi:hypothetical protein
MKPNIFLTAIICVSALASCVHERHITIATSTNGNYREIEYAGLVKFDQKTHDVSAMSPNSWVKYKENGLQLYVKCDETDQIYYQLNGEEKTPLPTAEEKLVLQRAERLLTEHLPKAPRS